MIILRATCALNPDALNPDALNPVATAIRRWAVVNAVTENQMLWCRLAVFEIDEAGAAPLVRSSGP